MVSSRTWMKRVVMGLAAGAIGLTACTKEEAPPAPAPQPAAAKPAPTATPSPAAAPAGGTYTETTVTNGGTIAGTVALTGSAPKLEPQTRNKDPKVCGTTGPNETLLVGAGGGVQNAIVWLTDIHSGKKLVPATSTLNQTKCGFSPHVQALPVGSSLTVINSDPVLHNVHASLGATTVFNYAMPIVNQKIPTKLTKAGIVRLKCDVHGWMNGAIGVMPNPYFAVTGADGSFTIADVPPGTYTVHAWHETLGDRDTQVTVPAGGKAQADLKYAVK